MDTARVLRSLDLLITSDTSVAHLAGALAVPTWLLLTRVPDWRWGLLGTSTPWYPTMRLFRQTECGNWNGVLDRVAAALQVEFPPAVTIPRVPVKGPHTQRPNQAGKAKGEGLNQTSPRGMDAASESPARGDSRKESHGHQYKHLGSK